MMVLILIIGLMFATSVFLLLQPILLKKLFGLMVLSSAINLVIFICGRLDSKTPPFIGQNEIQDLANPLPQALVLTAIVIGFALLAYLCSLLKVLLNKE